MTKKERDINQPEVFEQSVSWTNLDHHHLVDCFFLPDCVVGLLSLTACVPVISCFLVPFSYCHHVPVLLSCSVFHSHIKFPCLFGYSLLASRSCIPYFVVIYRLLISFPYLFHVIFPYLITMFSWIM